MSPEILTSRTLKIKEFDRVVPLMLNRLMIGEGVLKCGGGRHPDTEYNLFLEK